MGSCILLPGLHLQWVVSNFKREDYGLTWVGRILGRHQAPFLGPLLRSLH